MVAFFPVSDYLSLRFLEVYGDFWMYCFSGHSVHLPMKAKLATTQLTFSFISVLYKVICAETFMYKL